MYPLKLNPEDLGQPTDDKNNDSPSSESSKAVLQACKKITVNIPKVVSPVISLERLAELRRIVEDAIKDHRTFTVKGGYNGIRNALLQRGWIEKVETGVPIRLPNKTLTQPNLEELCTNLPKKLDTESSSTYIGKCEKTIISRLLQFTDADFYWHLRKDNAEWHHRFLHNQLNNRFNRSLFTSKEGLCLLLQQMHWFNETGLSFVQYPRCYMINIRDQFTSFVDDFHITACIGLLKWLTLNVQMKREAGLSSPDGIVPVNVVRFAIDRCNDFISVQRHFDIDKEISKITDHEWEEFLTYYYLLVHGDEKFVETKLWSLTILETSARNILMTISRYWPQMDIDGIKNIWIAKPGNKCRGRGIQLIKSIKEVNDIRSNKGKYVVQKYIERPLIIYKTKFDIRQWFLLTSTQPLIIWMYRQCYLRFSTQKFSLDDFHESIHLTNNAVQSKYKNCDRDKALPDDNMWDNNTFQCYLRQIGQGHKWTDVIYPGMKECIIGAMVASQETMDKRPNTFELFGADFMLAENFTPWLLEINSSPDMSHSTSVTARMCPQVLEDVIKVVIDKRRDIRADTGGFDMIYRQNLPFPANNTGVELYIRGRKILNTMNSSSGMNHPVKSRDASPEKSYSPRRPFENMEASTTSKNNYQGPVIEDLIEELRKKLFNSKCVSVRKETDNSAKASAVMDPATQGAAKLKQNKTTENKKQQKKK